MATYNENIEYLRDERRFPKINKNPIREPNKQFSGEEYNRIIEILSLSDGAGSIIPKLSMAEYLDMVSRHEVTNSLYTIYRNGSLYRVYLGETLIMKKQSEGESVTIGGVFPIIFPIIFP